VPTIRDLASRVNITMELCPDYVNHYTLAERPPTSNKACYVNPFVLHGYYAKYLRPWVRFYCISHFDNLEGILWLIFQKNSYGDCNLHVVDFSEFEAKTEEIMQGIGQFLGLKDFKFKVTFLL
jgi:hypothetical protein